MNLAIPKSATVNATAAQNASSASSPLSSSSSSGLDSLTNTFMTLLLAELKNQDPTSPMDTTAMVGQMISLNQLDTLMNIQSILGSALGTGTTGSVSNRSPFLSSALAQHSAYTPVSAAIAARNAYQSTVSSGTGNSGPANQATNGAY